MGRFLEGDGDLARPRPQPLARPQIEGRPLPAPVRDMAFQRDIAFGPRCRILAVLDITALPAPGQILPPHDILGAHRIQRADHLQLLVPHRIRVKVIRRFHRDQAQKLHQMVLHHVPHRARLVVIGAAPLDPHRFGHRDLHMVNVFGLPQRLEQDVGKTDSHQVLHRLLSQIMVDPVNLVLVEMLGQHGVQRARRCQIAPKGLFHHDARPCIRDAMGMQPLRNIAKQRWRDREIEGPHDILAHHPLQDVPASRPLGVDRDIAHPIQKRRHLRLVLPRRGHEFGNRLTDHPAEVALAQLGARGANDPALYRHLPGQKPQIQPRQNLAPGQIACAAKDHQIEGIDRNDARNHGQCPPLLPDQSALC